MHIILCNTGFFKALVSARRPCTMLCDSTNAVYDSRLSYRCYRSLNTLHACTHLATYTNVKDRPRATSPTHDHNRNDRQRLARSWIRQETAKDRPRMGQWCVACPARDECTVEPAQTSLPLDRVTAMSPADPYAK